MNKIGGDINKKFRGRCRTSRNQRFKNRCKAWGIGRSETDGLADWLKDERKYLLPHYESTNLIAKYFDMH
jgi:hypothetical protein